MKRLMILSVASFLLAGTAASGRNIDLVTLPPRNAVQLTIYNSEDLTLVKETRSITFKRGANRLQFSWANTLIDPTSVHFRPIEHEDQIEVLDTTFPADRPQVLVWNVESEFQGQARVEVSYFTAGITWSADYVMITDPAETQMSFDGYVTVRNNSGEDYEGANVRLVVGVVNLVEKIAQLAAGQAPAAGARHRAMRKAITEAEVVAFASAPAEDSAPQVVKEGLSEYFIFTIEGEQTVPNQWSQRMVSFRAADVPFEIVYRYRPHQYGPRPVRFFVLANDAEHKLGESPLPDGVIRVFRRNPRDGLAYYTTQSTRYIPIKAKVELNVGTDDQIVYERVVLDAARDHFVFDNHRPPRVVGWDETVTWREEIRNYRDKPIVMEIRHVIDGHVDFYMEDAPKLFDYRTVAYSVELPASQERKWTSKGAFHHGRNQQQQRMHLKDAE